MADLPDRSTATTIEYGGVAYTPVVKQVTITTSGNTTVWTPASNKKIVITDIIVSTDTAMTVTIKDNQATPVTYIVAYLAQNGGFVSNFTTPIKLPTNVSLVVNTSATGNVGVTVCGYEE